MPRRARPRFSSLDAALVAADLGVLLRERAEAINAVVYDDDHSVTSPARAALARIDAYLATVPPVPTAQRERSEPRPSIERAREARSRLAADERESLATLLRALVAWFAEVRAGRASSDVVPNDVLIALFYLGEEDRLAIDRFRAYASESNVARPGVSTLRDRLHRARSLGSLAVEVLAGAPIKLRRKTLLREVQRAAGLVL